ncbi:MAG: hypothetical protein ABIM60_07130, partial [candidate division WOR-3 bacterium]
EELKEELKEKFKEFKDKKRKINQELFKSLSNSVVHLYPDKKIDKLDLINEVKGKYESIVREFIKNEHALKEIIKNEKEEKKVIQMVVQRWQRWFSNIFEGIYVFKNVEYDDKKGAIVIDKKENSHFL